MAKFHYCAMRQGEMGTHLYADGFLTVEDKVPNLNYKQIRKVISEKTGWDDDKFVILSLTMIGE